MVSYDGMPSLQNQNRKTETWHNTSEFVERAIEHFSLCKKIKTMEALGTKELQTSRLILRQLQIKDAADLFIAGSLGENIEDATQLVQNMMRYNDDPRSFSWVLEYQGKAIGRIKAWEINPQNNYVQLGYDIGEAYRNKGLMTEAVRAVSIYLLKECECNRVYCMIRENNPASLRVCEKAGFLHEGTMRKHWVEPDKSYTNVYVYGLLLSDL